MNTAEINLQPNQAVVIIVIPHDVKYSEKNGILFADDTTIAYKESVNIPDMVPEIFNDKALQKTALASSQENEMCSPNNMLNGDWHNNWTSISAAEGDEWFIVDLA